jgi:hypothetical protein
LTRGHQQAWFLPQSLLNSARSCLLRRIKGFVFSHFSLVPFPTGSRPVPHLRKQLRLGGFPLFCSSSTKNFDIVSQNLHQSCNRSSRCHPVYAHTPMISHHIGDQELLGRTKQATSHLTLARYRHRPFPVMIELAVAPHSLMECEILLFRGRRCN